MLDKYLDKETQRDAFLAMCFIFGFSVTYGIMALVAQHKRHNKK